MKNFISILFILCSFFVSAQTKNITSSEIRWKAYKTLKAESMSHNGTVKLKSGNLTFNGNEFTGGNFIINMNTIDAEDMNENPKQKKFLENHLKSDDFFDVEKFPVTVFQIKSVKTTGFPFTICNRQNYITGITKTTNGQLFSFKSFPFISIQLSIQQGA